MKQISELLKTTTHKLVLKEEVIEETAKRTDFNKWACSMLKILSLNFMPLCIYID